MVSQSRTKPLFNFLGYIYVYDVRTCYSYIELWIERNFLGFSRYYFSSAKKKKARIIHSKAKIGGFVMWYILVTHFLSFRGETTWSNPGMLFFLFLPFALSFCCSAPHVAAKGRVINQHFCAKPYNVVTLTDEYLLVFYFLVHLPSQSWR